MILDNKNTNLKGHEWIAKYTKEGKFSLVTGFFTIGALAYLSDKINEKIKAFNFVLGDIVHTENVNVRTIDLLNDNIKHPHPVSRISRFPHPDRIRNPKQKITRIFTQELGSRRRYVDYRHALLIAKEIADFSRIRRSESFKRFALKVAQHNL